MLEPPDRDWETDPYEFLLGDHEVLPYLVEEAELRGLKSPWDKHVEEIDWHELEGTVGGDVPF